MFVKLLTQGAPKVLTGKIDTICELQYPITVTNLRYFLGLYSAFQRFMANYIRVAALLNNKFRKGQLLCWTSQRQNNLLEADKGKIFEAKKWFRYC